MTALTALVKTDTDKNIYESLALRGDISALNPQDKAAYLQKLCESLGLNPFTQPFIPLKLNGKEILYASRGATDQLSSLNKLNREIIKTERLEDVYIVTCKVTSPDGRFEIGTGAVTLGNFKGDQLANALMKAETKAKRRATLSFCGLGFMDESELETVQNKIETDNGFPVNPVAKSLSDLVTAKQLGMMRAIAREIGIDADEECSKVLKCRTDELSIKAASSFIGYLQDLQHNGIGNDFKEAEFSVVQKDKTLSPGNAEDVQNFTPAQEHEIGLLRDELIILLRSVNTDPAKSVNKFDSLDYDGKVNALRETMKMVVKTVIGSDNWGLTDDGTTAFLAKFGIEAIDQADGEQLAKVIGEMRSLGNL